MSTLELEARRSAFLEELKTKVFRPQHDEIKLREAKKTLRDLDLQIILSRRSQQQYA